MHRKVFAVVAVFALLTTSGIVIAQQCNCGTKSAAAYGAGPAKAGMGSRGMGKGMGKGMMFERMAKELNLSQAQIQQLEQIRSQYMTATQATRDQLKAERQTMMNLWMSDNPDPAAIKAEFAKIDQLKAQLRDTGVDYAVQGMKVLTPDQRTRLRTMIQNKMGQCRAMGMGMGFGCEMDCHDTE